MIRLRSTWQWEPGALRQRVETKTASGLIAVPPAITSEQCINVVTKSVEPPKDGNSPPTKGVCVGEGPAGVCFWCALFQEESLPGQWRNSEAG